MSEKAYNKIYNDIIDSVKNGTLVPGDKLLTEKELMDKYAVSRTTVRNALQQLERMNLIYRIKKSGTFLNGKKGRVPMIIPIITPVNVLSDNAQNMMLQNNCFSPIYITKNDWMTEAKALHAVLNTHIDALIIYPSSTKKNIENLSKIRIKGIPVVFLDRRYLGFDCPLITANNKAGMFKLVSRLISMGHEKIAYLAIGDVMHSSEVDRFTGYCQAHIHHNIPVRQSYVFKVDAAKKDSAGLEASYRAIARKLVKTKDRPTAVCCINDNVAKQFIDLLREVGLECPRDISVTGFDDNKDIALQSKPPLTTVAQPFKELAESAVLAALDLLANNHVPQVNMVDVKIIERESVRAIE